jgi:hypothetical protein
MWMPSQIPALASEARAAGLELDPSVLADPKKEPLAAVVSLGGCSASFVSKKGLVITNHHCVTGALQHNSDPKAGKDYIHDGFSAKTLADEPWAGPGSRVLVTERITDVTEQVTKGLADLRDPAKRYAELEARTKKLIADCEAADPKKARRCSVTSFFGGGEWRLVEQLELRDVRLVFAPAEGIGNFGGETDNWRWPRHVGDFSFFRAYVGKDGAPADYSPDNVPYEPASILPIAKEGIRAGDFVAVAGYPGSTDRLRTADELEDEATFGYARKIKMCDDFLGLFEGLAKTDPDLAVKTETWVRGCGNARTFWKGVLDGFAKAGVQAKKRATDDGLAASTDPKVKAALGDALARMKKLADAKKAGRVDEADVNDALRFVTLLGAAHGIVRMAEERPKPDAERDPAYQDRNAKRLREQQQRATKTYDRRIDEAALHLALKRALSVPEGAKGPLAKALFGAKGAPANDALAQGKKRIADLFDKTTLGDEKARLELLEKAKPADLAKSKDPLLALARELRQTTKKADDRDKATSGELVLLRPKYVAALRAAAGRELAPDANGTLRITFGQVRGYQPAPDKPLFFPQTKLAEVVAKHQGKGEFDAPVALLEAAKAGKRGRYLDAALGDVPVDFLSNLDTTGGNSGSPTLNARGELCGLLFDGNYEAMASDWVFLPELTRSIHVDIRYVLWVLDAVYHADRVLGELGVTPELR